MSMKWVLVVPLMMMLLLGSASSGKVLVWPADYSHWMNIKSIIHELAARGHQVTVLLPSFYQEAESSGPSNFHLEVISVPFSKKDMDNFMQDFLHVWSYEKHDKSFWDFSITLYDFIIQFMSRYKFFCDNVFWNEKLLQKLESAAFDVLISDPVLLGGELLAEKLHVPFLYSLRFSFGNMVERICGNIPAPPSYVPASMGELTDRMSFMERMANMLTYFSHDVVFHHLIFKEWNKYYSDVIDGHYFVEYELVGSSCGPRHSQNFPPTLKFKSIYLP